MPTADRLYQALASADPRRSGGPPQFRDAPAFLLDRDETWPAPPKQASFGLVLPAGRRCPASPAPGYRESHVQCGFARRVRRKIATQPASDGIDRAAKRISQGSECRKHRTNMIGRSVASDKDRRWAREDSKRH